MKKGILVSLISLAMSLSLVTFSHFDKKGTSIDNSEKYAPEGMVAYAASYGTNITDEPKYSTQNSKTFQYLGLGNTLNYYRGDSVKVGIIDSGINYDHEDFMVNSVTKVKGTSKYYSYQNSGWVYYGATQHGYSYIDDTLGHGTNVAATVAAAVNSVGGLGLAPNVELYVYKVTNASNGYEFGAIQLALKNAVSLGLDVVNMSFQSYEHAVSYNSSSMGASTGCSTIMSSYLNAAHNAGITLVGAAGNFNTDEPSYPGSNNYVINVGSLNQTGDDKAPFSNYGNNIDIVAPGYVYVADEASDSAYTNTQGTSFSAPLVTAAIALYKQQNPSATPAQIESALYASCDPIDDSSSPYTGWAGNGALNVSRFLNISESDTPINITINNPEIVDDELELEVGDTFDLDWTVEGVGTFSDDVNIYAFDDNGTLSVDSNGRITALAEGSDYVIIESDEKPSVYTEVYVEVTASSAPPTVSSVTVSPNSLSLDLNGTTIGNLSATVNGTNNPAQTVNWSSSNTNIATVNSGGVVTAKAVGSATITATSTVDNTKSGTCTVTVSDSTVHVSSVSLNKNALTLTEGDSETLTATVSPNNATNKNVTWTSSDSTIATVNSSGSVTAVKNGSATITVTTQDGSKTATCSVTVNKATTATYTITFATSGSDSSSALTTSNFLQAGNVSSNSLIQEITALSKCYSGKNGVKLGSSSAVGSFSATVKNDAKYNVKSITITSTKYVDDTGDLTISYNSSSETWAPNEGTKTINFVSTINISSFTIATSAKRAYVGSISFVVDTSGETPPEPSITSISLNKNAVNLDLNGTISDTLVATVTGENNPDLTVTWSSNNPSVATVNNSGVVTAVSVGNATITATSNQDGTKTAICSVTVVDTTPEPDPDPEPQDEDDKYVSIHCTDPSLTLYTDSVTSSQKITAQFSKASGSTDPKYFDTGDAVRAYAKNTITISSAKTNIKKIVLSFGTGGGSNSITVNSGTYSAGTWTGDLTNSVIFTIGGTSGHRRISDIRVEYYSSVNFAYDFLNGVTCNDNGASAPTVNWSALSTKFNNYLFDADKNELKTASTTGDTNTAKAMKLYDYIVGKYGTSSYADFIDRNPSSLSNKNLLNIYFDNEKIVVIFACFTLLSLAAMLFYYFKRRKVVN